MTIDLPSDGKSSGDSSAFGGRIDLYEAYWLYVDGVRCVGPVLRQSEATKEDTDRSPLARHYNHFYEKKEDHKERCSDLPGNLPKYKEHFKEPRGDISKVPRENLQDLGIELEEEDDPIWLPPEYELPSVWGNDLEDMREQELRELVRTLRSEKRKLEDDRNKLRDQLISVKKSLSNYIDLKQSDGTSQSNVEVDSPRTCENCGRTFDSKAAKHGHSSHCGGSNGKNEDHSQNETTTEDLEQLAKELPEINETQSAEYDDNVSHDEVSEEEELDNLNHLLSGSL